MKQKIPNLLSLLRVLISPVFLIMIISGNSTLIIWSLVLFTIGAITDYFDGWLARKMKAVSSWGKFFDPLADKFLTSAAFIAFVVLDFIPLWMVVIIIIRDFGTTLLRLFKFSDKELKTSKTAKFKTLLQMIFIFAVIVIYTLMQIVSPSFAATLASILHSPIVYITMLLITLITVWSLIEYVWFLLIAKD